MSMDRDHDREARPESFDAFLKRTFNRAAHYHWRCSEDLMALQAGDEVLAAVFPRSHTSSYWKPERPEASFRMTVPESVSIFDAVEARLGLSRVSDVREWDHTPSKANLRGQEEARAKAFRDAHRTPDGEARFYVNRALTALSPELQGSEQGHSAKHVLEELSAALDETGDKWTIAHRNLLDEAHGCLSLANQSDPVADARLDCERAMATLSRTLSVAKEYGVSHDRGDGIVVFRDHADYGVEDPGWERDDR
jgi:hypothetical protein